MAKAKMKFKQFEKADKAADKKQGVKEGSKKDNAIDAMRFKRGGAVCKASGGIMRGTGAATKGKKFQGEF